MSDHQNTSESKSTTEIDIEAEITNLEESFAKLKQRYQQVKVDQERKEELNARKQEIKAESVQKQRQDSLKSELKYINDELAEIEFRLESELFKWSSLSEPFWQIVRFLGIGIVIGWFLNS